MAISDLKAEAKILESLFDGVNKRGPGSLHFELNKEIQEHTISVKGLSKQLLEHGEDLFKGKRKWGKKDTDEYKKGIPTSEITVGTVGGKEVKFDKHGAQGVNKYTAEYEAYKKKFGDALERPFADFKREVIGFCMEYVTAIKAGIPSQPSTSVVKSGNTFITFAMGQTSTADDVYDRVSVFTKETAESVVNSRVEYQNLFARSKSDITKLINVGHRMGVVVEKAGMLAKSIDTAATVLGSDSVKSLTAKVEKMFADAEVTFDLNHAREVDIKTGLLKDNRKVLSDAETAFFNAAKANRPDLIGKDKKTSEANIGRKIKKLIKDYRALLKEEYEKAPEHLKSSQSMMQAARAMIIHSAIEGANKKTTKVKSKVTKPKSIKPRSTNIVKQKYKNNYKRMKADTLALAGAEVKHKKLPNPPRATTESGTSLAPLIALLNSKLPQTVARNMGPPGLENQTGRFASSVQVTDVSRTAQGFPSVGYDYRRNPYQVFEMGSGQPPWATPDRDPRKVIDQSIREIAAQFAIGRFYTRRI